MAGVHVSVGADSKKAERELSSFEQKTRKIAKSIQKGFQERIGHKLFDGLAGAARAIPGMLNEAIQSASSLNEEISKSQTIFGRSADEIRKWAKGAAESMGLSEVAALEASGTIGNMFTAMGMTGKEAANMSKSMVQLAADLGSFNNTSTDDAIQAIGAALRGESEPIRRYGVLLDDATLKAEAFAKGIYDGKGTLAPATRALAAYSVIIKQTTAAQGDFVKTSDGLANSKKILSAQFENASTEIGKALLPAMQALVDLMREIDWEEMAKDVGAFAEGFAILAKNVGDAYNSFKSFPEEVMKTLGILKDVKKEFPNMFIFAGEFESPSKTEEDDRFDRRTKALENAIERDKETGDRFHRGTKALMEAIEREKLKASESALDRQKKSVDQNREESKSVFDLIQSYKQLTAEKVKSIREEIAQKRAGVLGDLSAREAETLAEFGMGQASVIKNRISELMSMGLGEKESKNIAGRESNIDKLLRTRDMLSNLANQSNVLAVSSMQRIGGGGGVTTQLDLQKRQATLQEQMVRLLEQIKDQSPRENISDF